MKRNLLDRRILLPEQEVEIVRRYTNGESANQIAQSIITKMGNQANTMLIWRILHRHGVVLRKQGIPEEIRCKVVELSATCTIAEVAEKVGIAMSSVSRILEKFPKVKKQTNRGRKRKFTQEQEEAIVKRYLIGDESISAIADTLDVSRITISFILSRHGVKTRLHQHALTPSQEEEVVRRFTEGETGRDLAKHFGIDATSINAIVRRRGGPLRRCGRRRHFESREEWLKQPAIRLRKLLQTAKANAFRIGREFDDELFNVFAANQPTNCACCGVELDYVVYARDDPNSNRSPSLDRCNNLFGYIVGNVYIICLRCNRLKSDASLMELQKILTYVTRHFEISIVK